MSLLYDTEGDGYQDKYKKHNSKARNHWVLTIVSVGMLSPITIPMMYYHTKKAKKYKRQSETI